jgi:hypothetical protein
VFPGDKRKSMDTRRSGAVEAIAGGADEGVAFSVDIVDSVTAEKVVAAHRSSPGLSRRSRSALRGSPIFG